MKDTLTVATSVVINVGDGRGFIMETTNRYRARVVVTAAHCLPHLPPAMSFSATEERTYQGLLGPLGDKSQTIWAECLFVDPIADIAVLGNTDNQEYSEQAEAFDDLTGDVEVIRIGDISGQAPAWLLSLDRHWHDCTVNELPGGRLWVTNAAGGIVGGMSGSPIMSEDGKAIGVLSTHANRRPDEVGTGGGPQARLTMNLPGWLLKDIC